MIAAAGHDEDPPEGLVFQKLIPVGHLKLPHRARRLAGQKHRIAVEEIALAELVERSRPGLERRDLGDVAEILQQSVAVHRHIGPGFHQHRGARPGPVSRFTRRGAQARLAVGPAWNRRGGSIARGRFQGCQCRPATSSNTLLFVPVRTTEVPQTCGLPSRASRPCTVTASPGLSESMFQPLRSKSS